MNRKKILKKSASELKQNFWIYLLAVLIVGIISGISGGLFNAITMFSRTLATIRSGMFAPQDITNPNSEIWNIVQSNRGMFGGAGFFGILISIFLVSPLSVGLNMVFLQGTRGKPKVETILEPFRNKYMNIVSTMFLTSVLMEIIIFAISFIFMIATGILVGIVIVVENIAQQFLIVSVIAAAVVFLAMFVGYFAWLLNISYNFSMIGYILCKHPECSFTNAYNMSKTMVANNKLKIFSVDFSISIWMVLSIMIPIAVMCVGAFMMITSAAGAIVIIIGMFLIFPVMCLNTALSMFRNTAWANIYNELQPALKEDSFVNSENSTYESPVYNEPISYVNNDEEDTNCEENNEENKDV